MADPDTIDLGPEGLAGFDGQVVPFEARGAVKALFECQDDEVIISGPAGTGKSRGALEKIHYLLLNFPGSRALVTRKTLVSLTESGLVTYRNEVLHRMDGVWFYGGSKAKAAQFNYPNGSELLVGGLDQATKVMSTQYDIIYVQEANEITENEHEMLTTRLRNGKMPFQQIILDVNPQEPWHWILRRAQRGSATMLYSVHEDNPRLFDANGNLTKEGAVYMRRLDRLTGVRLQRLRHGRWVAAEGIVYEEFDQNVHMIDPFKIPQDWPRYRSIDFGFVNPFVCQWWSVGKDNELYMYREWYRTQMTVSKHARRIEWLTGAARISATVADHDAEDRATLLEEGITTVPARKAILPGIDAVKERLKIDARGKTQLYIFKNALVARQRSLGEEGKPTWLGEELFSYAWPDESKQARDRLAKEVPMDLNNHSCDAMRYIVMHIDHKVPLVGPGGVTSSGSKWLRKHSRDQ